MNRTTYDPLIPLVPVDLPLGVEDLLYCLSPLERRFYDEAFGGPRVTDASYMTRRTATRRMALRLRTYCGAAGAAEFIAGCRYRFDLSLDRSACPPFRIWMPYQVAIELGYPIVEHPELDSTQTRRPGG